METRRGWFSWLFDHKPSAPIGMVQLSRLRPVMEDQLAPPSPSTVTFQPSPWRVQSSQAPFARIKP